MDLSVDVQGLDDVVRALHRVEQKTSIRVTRAALRFAAKPAIERAKQLVPYDGTEEADTYSLRDSIGVRLETKKNRAGNATSMRFGAHRETLADDSGYKIAGGLNKGAKAPNYASLVNDETPFLMPAIEQTLPEILRRFGAKITESVNRL